MKAYDFVPLDIFVVPQVLSEVKVDHELENES